MSMVSLLKKWPNQSITANSGELTLPFVADC